MMSFFLVVFFHTFHNCSKPQAVPKISLGFTVTELFSIPVNLEIRFRLVKTVSSVHHKAMVSPSAPSPPAHPLVLPFP